MFDSPVIDDELLSSPTAVALLDAGIDQFGQYGLKATTRNVAEQANANIASIPYYFRNKQGLYKACMHYIVDNIWRDLGAQLNTQVDDDISKADAQSLFVSIVDSFCSYFLERQDALRWSQFIMREHATPTDAYDIFYSRYYQHVQQIKTRLWAKCVERAPDDPFVQVQCHAIFGQVLSFLVARESLLRGLNATTLTEEHVRLARDIVRQNVTAIIQHMTQQSLKA